MPFKLENALPLFIYIYFTQVKVKGRHASQIELYISKKIILTQKRHCEFGIIIAMN